MDMELLKKWLNNPRRLYLVGVNLYNTYGNDAGLKRLFNAESETAYKREKLISAIKAIVTGAQARITEEKAQAAGETASAATQASFFKGWPRESNKDAVELGLWESAVVLLKTIAHKHSTLMHLPDDNQRKAVAFEILRHDEELDKVYEQREYYGKNGHLLGNGGVDPTYVTDPFLMAKEIANLTRYIRRERAAIAEDATNFKAAERLKKFITSYNYYAEKLGKEQIC